MKIVVIGASGTIGKNVADEFSKRHEVLYASRTNCKYQVDISSEESIQQLFSKIGMVDAIICAAGSVKWDLFENMSEADYYVGIQSKMMGQVNLVRIGKNFISKNGSFTLTTGILADDPVLNASGSALANGAINSFAKAVAREQWGNFRINVVSPGLLEASAERLGAAFPGHVPVAVNRVIAGYVKSVEGLITGEVIRIY